MCTVRPPPTDRARRPALRRRALAVCALLALATAAPAAEIPGRTQDRAPRWVGLGLDEALQRLAAEGLPLVFSSGLVNDAMRVASEPEGDSPRERLDSLLAPHGLVVRESLGRLVVVPAPPRVPALRGRVATSDGRPLAGVAVSVTSEGGAGAPGEPAAAVESDASGAFRFDGLPAGRYTVEAGRPGFVIGRWPGVELTAGRDAELTLVLVAAPAAGDEIVVTSGGAEPGLEAVAERSLPPGRAAALPHHGDDALRAAGLLPGAATTEASSRLRVRGGRDDEVLLLLDGLELRAPYHLQEFDSALSIVAPASLQDVDLLAGGYPAEYGGRMGGVLEMTTVPPSGRLHAAVGVGSYYGQLSGSGRFAGDRGGWFGVGRAGNYRLALEIAGRPADPRYWDLFGKADYSPAPGHELRLDVLAAEDEFEDRRGEPGGDRFLYGNRWRSRYAWLTWDAVLGDRLFAETAASYGRIERGRNGEESGADGGFRLHDRRTVEIAGLKQGWTFLLGDRAAVKWGFDVRREEAALDYGNRRELLEPLAAVRTTPAVGATEFAGRIDGNEVGAYASVPLRLRPDLTVELGLRYDHPAVTSEHLVSPRFNLGWAPTGRDRLRAAWGWFYQSQRPDELQIEDGETGFARAERSEHRVLGWEHRFDGGARFEAEAFERWLSHPRARYENLFDPVLLSPELSPDRVLIAPERGRSRGLELIWRGAERRRLSWSAVYTLAAIEDRLDGRWVPRSADATHALRAEADVRFHRGWNLGLVWSYHTGWPTTAVGGRAVAGADGGQVIEPVLGALNAERLPDYHRLDLRLRREWELGRGKLSAYLDLQNLYDRDNVRGFDEFVFATGADGAVAVDATPESWGGFLPSFGVRWSF